MRNLRMTFSLRSRLTAAVFLVAGASAAMQQQPDPSARSEKAESYSPLGFEDLRAYQQAYPGVPGSAAVVRASATKYWVFRGIAYRGSNLPQGPAWASLG